MTHREWHQLYPLVLVRLNTLISKYGLSREYVHFQDMNETHLPLIVDINLHPDLQSDLDHTAHRFRGAIQKFLNNKEKSKKHYPKGKEHNFILHELVMRKDYTPASALSPTFVGPYRIIELQPQGAIIKDPRTGDIMSVHFQNLRKLSIDEFKRT
jgi:hypothetical protein